MDQKVMKVLRAREGGHVRRCHTTPYQGDYTVGKHTFDMLVLLHILHSKPTKALYQAILLHDLAERYTGDVPGDIGGIDPDFKQAKDNATNLVDECLGYVIPLTDKEKIWLKALDRLELWLWCHDEINGGNDHVRAIVDELEEWFSATWKTLPNAVRRFYQKFEWRRTEGKTL